MRDDVRADALLASLENEQKGKLKIFLGAAPGVGKTYAMLQAVREQAREEVDLLIGVVETHGRRETLALLDKLPMQPRMPVYHRGQRLEEMDLDGLLARKPALAVVDELAHSNAPGCRHEKRWQDVQELLAAGIDVYTTLNVQHLESLNDLVWQLTGVRVRETLPDQVLLDADSLVLIDLPPKELLERLREGKVYVPHQARAALQSFFSLNNLTALRELAMQTAASHVEGDLQLQWQAAGKTTLPLRGKLMVCLGDEQGAALVRHGHRFAQRRQLPWLVVHVDTRGETSTETEQALTLASQLGAKVLTLSSPSVADALLETAEQQQVSQLLLGKPHKIPWRPSLVQHLIRAAQGLEVTLVDLEHHRPSLHRFDTQPGKPHEYLLSLGIMGITSAGSWLLSEWLPPSSMPLIFVLGVMTTALSTSLLPATMAALLGFAAHNLLFVHPLFSLTVDNHSDLLTLLVLLIVGMTAGRLASRQRQQLISLRESQHLGNALLSLSQALTKANTREEVLRQGSKAIARALGAKIRVLDQEYQEHSGSALPPPGQTDKAAIDWCLAQKQNAGAHTATLNAAESQYHPLTDELVLGIHLSKPLSAGAERQLQALLADMRAALARIDLDERLADSQLQAETDRMRAALLSSVSHDLKTPLSTIMGAGSTLLEYGERITPEERTELLQSVQEEASRLHGYVQNLLDMTRIGSPDFQLKRDWVAIEDLVESARHRLEASWRQHKMLIHIDQHVPQLYVHGALLEQVLVNILDNASRYSPVGTPIELKVMLASPDLIIDIIDIGVGIAESDRDKIFNLFYTQPVGDCGSRGTGLGLAISRAMIEAHGGRIWAFPGPNRIGTCMRITLPLALNSPET
ncbi:sensor histidine kinase [Aeromonas simiae]|uniref:sensor histidine kinase n=1 Tax=Aeromonas simiae TaxID=218936 RepID=UPI00266C2633|nr:sensor histidine kinase KdpD [Aeromonas simiae]MDO2950082.1 sensor histidine kinase KdpD [Aeromonas simiae]MDO2953777.1 sensor histidine kinase KdpD [Aeromonas simiae]MDO2957454.1 sensor histidine kinase KdpD [Aeromonas simiae]